MTADAAYDAIVLAGGAARRLGGVDKPALSVGGRALLDRVLMACREAGRTVVVAEPRPTARPVRWAREEPPGGGPLAALEAGLREVSAPAVLVLSADLPFLADTTVRALLAALAEDREPAAPEATGPAAAPDRAPAPGPEVGTEGPGPSAGGPGPGAAPGGEFPGPLDGVLVVDQDGREQPLVAAYRTEALRRELALLTEEYGSLAGRPLRALVKRLRTARIEAGPLASFDCDTWEDLARARARIREHGNVLDEWITAVKDELGIELDVDTGVLLDLARDAAHGVARPAAPLTTFLVGYAAAKAGGASPEADARAVALAAHKAAALAGRWAREAEEQAKEAATESQSQEPKAHEPSAEADGTRPAQGDDQGGARPGAAR
ncbi:NTP transferase domain-containing protein [Streptomyces sp. NPDC001941]|uniref:NTP transferase domain-containing protein n=1 Tax=Streptomyces sp. NPDC001941 TaxID=3154659 RepID=UPI00332D0094